MPKITPFLWFDSKAEEAINFYVSLFKNSKIHHIQKYPDQVPGMSGKVMHASFNLNGQEYMALDGGPAHKFNEAVSMYVDCDNQSEVDYLWSSLTSGDGQEGQCGWLKDKYGVSWQVIPKALGQLMSDPDPEKAARVMQAMLKMKKIVVADLEKAHRGE
jgi:predicted 3-demethylubiquinone-9 3-methyltransferase (glyoxalase superfamily)